MTETDFRNILEETRKAFDASDIKQCAPKETPWYYSVCATRITPGRLLILGFNWGAESNEPYQPQDVLPSKSFMEIDNKELGSLGRVKLYLRKYCLADLEDVGQSNFCFFRSKHASGISQRDLELCFQPFSKFIRVAQPKTIIGLSAHLKNHMLGSAMLRSVKTPAPDLRFDRGGRQVTCQVVKGVYLNESKKVPVYLLPHPNYPIPRQTREAAWDFCFK